MKPLISGNPQEFAIESCITHAYARQSIRAHGFFVLHLNGHGFGVREAMATALACSFDEVQRRISRRGNHTAFFSNDTDALGIATAAYDSIYGRENEYSDFRGLSMPQLMEMINAHGLFWAPDGDAAFDDGSFALHFDVGDRVRLIAFKLVQVNASRWQPDPTYLVDLWLGAKEFYEILKHWRDAFEAEWLVAPKI